jgi:hypothetical protein
MRYGIRVLDEKTVLPPKKNSASSNPSKLKAKLRYSQPDTENLLLADLATRKTTGNY